MNTETGAPTKHLSLQDGIVHSVLSHSYLVFFVAVILGAIFHTFFNVTFFSGIAYPYVGVVMIFVGSYIIYWAQSSSSSLKPYVPQHTEKDFERGPYKYSRNPTHIGLTIMILGLSVLLSSFFTFLFVIIASVVTKLIFLRKEEKILEEKYGQPYRDYKSKVSSWI